jgi:hypothetical protein
MVIIFLVMVFLMVSMVVILVGIFEMHSPFRPVVWKVLAFATNAGAESEDASAGRVVVHIPGVPVGVGEVSGWVLAVHHLVVAFT